MNNMFCTSCGSKLDKEVRFCTSCGASMDVDTSTEKVKNYNEFNFTKTLLRTTGWFFLLFLLLFGLSGAYEDGFFDLILATFILSCFLGVLVSLITKWWKRGVFNKNKHNESTIEDISKYKGIKGWLVLVGMWIIVFVGSRIYYIHEKITLFVDGTVEFMSDPSLELSYVPELDTVLRFELIADILLFVFGVYLIYLFFLKSKKFPKYLLFFLAFSVVIFVVDYLFIASMSFPNEMQPVMDDILSETIYEAMGFLTAVLILGVYTIKSKRVKATFVK